MLFKILFGPGLRIIENIECKTHQVTSVKTKNKIMQNTDANETEIRCFYAKIAIKHIFPMHKRSSGPLGLSFQHLPRDMANVNQ